MNNKVVGIIIVLAVVTTVVINSILIYKHLNGE